jgi:phenylpyruvate tautomerase
MPLINLYTSALAPDADAASALLRRLSSTLARELGKPEAYVMTCLVPQARMTFAASEAPACYAELKNIGELSPELTARLSRTLCDLLSEGLLVPKNRIYIEFQSVKPHLWGFDGETFA